MPGYIVGGDAGSPTIIEGSAEAVATHNADTTAVHGITDTSTLAVGPASATDNAVARFDGATGKLIQSGPVAITDAGKITGLADGTASSDAATVGQLATAGISPAILDANTVLKADADDTPAALAVGASTIVGRKATGGIAALTGAEVAALLSGIAPSAVTGTAAILGANTFTAAQTITGSSAAAVQHTVQGAASQSANLTEWKNSAGDTLANVTAAGGWNLGPGATTSLVVQRQAAGTAIYGRISGSSGTCIGGDFEADWSGAAVNVGVFLYAISGAANRALWIYSGGPPEGASNYAILSDSQAQSKFAGILLLPAASSSRASIRLPHGTAPTTPVDGDVWTTTAGMFVQINGVTKTVTLT